MQNLMQADIFFFITSVAVVLISLVIIVAAVYVIKILRELLEISRKAKEKTAPLFDDLGRAHEAVKDGMKLSALIAFAGKVLGLGKKRRKDRDE